MEHQEPSQQAPGAATATLPPLLAGGGPVAAAAVAAVLYSGRVSPYLLWVPASTTDIRIAGCGSLAAVG